MRVFPQTSRCYKNEIFLNNLQSLSTFNNVKKGRFSHWQVHISIWCNLYNSQFFFAIKNLTSDSWLDIDSVNVPYPTLIQLFDFARQQGKNKHKIYLKKKRENWELLVKRRDICFLSPLYSALFFAHYLFSAIRSFTCFSLPSVCQFLHI